MHTSVLLDGHIHQSIGNQTMTGNTSTRESDPSIPYADMDNIPEELKAPLTEYGPQMGFLPNALRL
jgi:hypothetical protein